jgi:colicin import membrane protein
MKFLVWIFVLLSLPMASHAQDDEAAAAQLARIATQRSEAEAAFRAQEKACYSKFAVVDCLNAAKAHRRQVLADLRRQEISINDAQRKRKAAEHLRAIEERSSPEKRQQESQRRTGAMEKQREREAAATQKAAERSSKAQEAIERAARKDSARSDASHSPNAADQGRTESKQAEAAAARSRRAEEAAQNVKRREQKQIDAEDRKASVEKRLAERKKPKAQALPTPP